MKESFPQAFPFKVRKPCSCFFCWHEYIQRDDMTWRPTPNPALWYWNTFIYIQHSNVTLISRKLKKNKHKTCAMFPDVPAVGCSHAHRKLHRYRQSLMYKNCSKPPSPTPEENTSESWKAWWGLHLSFSFIVLFAFSKAKITWSVVKDPEVPMQDQILGNVHHLEQVFRSPPQIYSTCYPRHLALGDLKAAFHSIHSSRSLASSRGGTRTFEFPSQLNSAIPNVPQDFQE